jgi:hypothetical protein
MEDGT